MIDYAIYMIDPDGIITRWNAGARRFKGYEEAEILGQYFSRFYTEATQAQQTLEQAAPPVPRLCVGGGRRQPGVDQYLPVA